MAATRVASAACPAAVYWGCLLIFVRFLIILCCLALYVPKHSTQDSATAATRLDKTPARRAPALPPTPDPPSPRLITVLEQDVLLTATDSTDMTNLLVEVPNALWPREDDDEWDSAGYTTCTVVDRCADGFSYAGGRSAPSHIIECDGDLFPVKTSALKTFIARQRRREGKQRASYKVLWTLLGDFIATVPPPSSYERRKDVRRATFRKGGCAQIHSTNKSVDGMAVTPQTDATLHPRGPSTW